MLRVSYLNHFASLRFHSVQQLAVHRLPVLGSPAGRCGLRLNYFICLRFALAFFSGSLVYSFHAVFPLPKCQFKTRRSTSHICCKRFSYLQTISLHHPCSTRRRLAMLGQCPQPVSLSLHSLQLLPSRLAQGCFSCVEFFPVAHSDNTSQLSKKNPSLNPCACSLFIPLIYSFLVPRHSCIRFIHKLQHRTQKWLIHSFHNASSQLRSPKRLFPSCTYPIPPKQAYSGSFMPSLIVPFPQSPPLPFPAPIGIEVYSFLQIVLSGIS